MSRGEEVMNLVGIDGQGFPGTRYCDKKELAHTEEGIERREDEELGHNHRRKSKNSVTSVAMFRVTCSACIYCFW